MLETVLVMIAGLALLVLLVAGLHRHQRMAVQKNADRHLPLPPLKAERRSLTLPEATRRQATAAKIKMETETETETEIETKQASVPTSDTTATNTSPASANTLPSWYERLAELKRENRLSEALALCHQELPLWSAFQQAVLIKRAQIKALQLAQHDIREELSALYRLATVAGFLHEHVKGTPALSLSRLKLLNLKQIFDLDMPYGQIGYLQLRLIKKTDIKWMVTHWGKPEQHQSPRLFHNGFWQRLVESEAEL